MEEIIPGGIDDDMEKYLRHQMTDKERHNFEQKMDADATLKAEVEGYARAFQAVQLKGRESLKKHFQDKDKTWIDSRPPAGSGKKYGLLGLALGLTLALALLFLFNNREAQGPKSPAQMLPTPWKTKPRLTCSIQPPP